MLPPSSDVTTTDPGYAGENISFGTYSTVYFSLVVLWIRANVWMESILWISIQKFKIKF